MQERLYEIEKLSNTLSLAVEDGDYKQQLFELYNSSDPALLQSIDKLAEIMWLFRTNQIEIREVEPDKVPFDDISDEKSKESSGFQLKLDKDYVIMPINGSDLVAFDSNPADYYEYMSTKFGSGWEYKATVDVKGSRCLLWGKWDDK